MGHLHDPDDPRHARMFELLRQREMAKATAQRLSNIAPQRSDVQCIGDFRTQAMQSLKGAQNDESQISRRGLRLNFHR